MGTQGCRQVGKCAILLRSPPPGSIGRCNSRPGDGSRPKDDGRDRTGAHTVPPSAAPRGECTTKSTPPAAVTPKPTQLPRAAQTTPTLAPSMRRAFLHPWTGRVKAPPRPRPRRRWPGRPRAGRAHPRRTRPPAAHRRGRSDAVEGPDPVVGQDGPRPTRRPVAAVHPPTELQQTVGLVRVVQRRIVRYDQIAGPQAGDGGDAGASAARRRIVDTPRVPQPFPSFRADETSSTGGIIETRLIGGWSGLVTAARSFTRGCRIRASAGRSRWKARRALGARCAGIVATCLPELARDGCHRTRVGSV